MTKLTPGLYDQILDGTLRTRLEQINTERLSALCIDLDSTELGPRLGEIVGSWVKTAINSIEPNERTVVGVSLLRKLLDHIQSVAPNAVDDLSMINSPVQSMVEIRRLSPANQPIAVTKPRTPLRETVLLTNARGQPSVGQEITTEIESADGIDIILAFIRWTGIRDLIGPLRAHIESGKTVRVITTTYTGSTEVRALEALISIGVQVKVSYDTTSTRLHAKAWLFKRNSGFSTVYIGSSNLTFSAQVTGLEWNVRAAQSLNPDLIAGFERTFDSYWEARHFESFDSSRFNEAVGTSHTPGITATLFDLIPHPFQAHILELLRIERQRGRTNNLVVAATGTGKTFIAAFEYRNLRSEIGRSRLLFVAHRDEILQQSLTVFRNALRMGSFGELWVGGSKPSAWDHVFASIQSITASDVKSIDPAHFDVVIVDEFHHAAADSYQALLDHLKPRYLLGLTATPERTDGLDILRWFDGRYAAELRVWDALEQNLLVPFQYYGIHDSTDLSSVTWRKGNGYDINEMSKLYTANDLWISKIIESVHSKIGIPRSMRALGFCVNIEHAEFMAKKFQSAGFNASAVTSKTANAVRSQKLDGIASGEIQIIFCVDLFNEGIDIPSIDVILLMRPTESATIFLQQIGRGLRKFDGKDVLTVLDFVGHQNKSFRFDLRFQRLLGRTRRELEGDIENKFPFLPAGCKIELDAVTTKIVLDNIKSAVPSRWPRLIDELRRLGDVTLPIFCQETGVTFSDVYRNRRSWTALRRAASFSSTTALIGELEFASGLSRITHLDDQSRIDSYLEFLKRETPLDPAQLDSGKRRQLEGLLLTLLSPKKGRFTSLTEAYAEIWRHTEMRNELINLIENQSNQISHIVHPMHELIDIPLLTHASYTREEILAAFGSSSVVVPLPLQSGTLWHQLSQIDIHFITLIKSDKEFSPTTRYLDYAISPDLFHWESQTATSVQSAAGQRYLNHNARGTRHILFIRQSKAMADGSRTTPYFNAGFAQYVSHKSDRPIQITWKLDSPLPGDIFANFRAAVA